MQFQRRDNHTIMSGIVVRYQEIAQYHNRIDRAPGDFEISASRDGVCICGNTGPFTDEYVRDIVNVLDRARVQYLRLADRQEPFPFEADPLCVVRQVDGSVMGNKEVIKSREQAPVA